MKNLQLNQTELLHRLQLYFPNIANIHLNRYYLAVTDFAVIHSDFFKYIINYFNHINILFYFYDAEKDQFEIIKKFNISNIHDAKKVAHFYFHENINQNQFSYFYIIYDPNYKFIILSDDSLDFSLLLYNINLVKKPFLKTIVDYFILFDEIITHV